MSGGHCLPRLLCHWQFVDEIETNITVFVHWIIQFCYRFIELYIGAIHTTTNLELKWGLVAYLVGWNCACQCPSFKFDVIVSMRVAGAPCCTNLAWILKWQNVNNVYCFIMLQSADKMIWLRDASFDFGGGGGRGNWKFKKQTWPTI